jgi:4-hydroxy-tetrahydrodipicolinate synthase
VKQELVGIIPPVVTPFLANEDLDEEAMRRELCHMLDAGVHGLTLSGSTGEGHTLTVEESCRLARIAIDETRGRIPVISGIIQDSTRAVIRYAKALKDEGVDGLQITPVHYLFAPPPEGALAYYAQIGDAVRLPIIIYNVVPWNTIDVPTLLRLADQQWIVGVKQSGGDIHKLADLLRAVRATGKRLRVLSAVDALLYASFLLGAHGSIAAILTILPRQCVALWDACAKGDIGRARELHERILPVWRLCEGPQMTSAIKAALEIQGRRVGNPRLPLQPLAPPLREELRSAIEASGELVPAERRASA